MKTIEMSATTDDDGVLDLHVSTHVPRAPAKIRIVIQQERPSPPPTDWADFVNHFFGICADAPIERGPQGEFEHREASKRE